MNAFLDHGELRSIWENTEAPRFKFRTFKQFVNAMYAEVEKASEADDKLRARLRVVAGQITK